MPSSSYVLKKISTLRVVFKALLFAKTCLYTFCNTFLSSIKGETKPKAKGDGIKKTSEKEEQIKGSLPQLEVQE